jgi:hypothetical protein
LVVTDDTPGLRQGAATSQLLMNLYAHHHLDRPWRRAGGAGAPLLRYVDDLLVACGSLAEARTARAELARLLGPTGWQLKSPNGGRSTIYDLDDGFRAPWLGFRLAWDSEDGMAIRLHENAWSKFTEKLKRAAASDRAGTAPDRFLHWVAQMGPAYPHVRPALYHRAAVSICRAAGLPAVPSASRFESAWVRSYESWLAVRAAAQSV